MLLKQMEKPESLPYSMKEEWGQVLLAMWRSQILWIAAKRQDSLVEGFPSSNS